MPSNFKSETLARILNDAKSAQPIDEKKRKNIYTPDEYNKKRAELLALDQVSNSEYLEPKHEFGAIEFDERGNLKEIGRNRPAMLDLAYYTRNRYEVLEVIPANEKKMGRERGTYIVVVIGNAIVKAISDVVELPKTVKAYVFKREETTQKVKKEVTKTSPEGVEYIEEEEVEEKVKAWRYVGAEMITSERVYKMTRQIAPRDMLKLLDQIEDDLNDGENIGGDSLDDIS